MPTNEQIEVSKLKLDLNNYRTVPQKNEEDAIRAMLAIEAERFYAIIESLIQDGYLPTENIIILKNNNDFIVREGNRRIAALKIIHGEYNLIEFSLPPSIIENINNIDAKWKEDNLKVPCSVYLNSEAEIVDRIIALAHGKGEKASRNDWNSVARARHNRTVNNATENGLDLLEKYLIHGKNLNNNQRERWGGKYSVTVLDEALRKIYSRLNFENVTELVKSYPNCSHLPELENILLEIGLEQIKFEIIRNKEYDFPSNYGIKPIVHPSSNVKPDTNTFFEQQQTTKENNSNTNTTHKIDSPETKIPKVDDNDKNQSKETSAPNTKKPPKANATNDPRHVSQLLRNFTPRGKKREKVVTLRDELKKLKIADNPIAFCFVLRSMFEISAKAYAEDHNLNITDKNKGYDKKLSEILSMIVSHLTNNQTNTEMVKILHGAKVEIGKSDGLLSVTSMNNLVHNPKFTVIPSDICTMFGNIFPLLEAMN